MDALVDRVLMGTGKSGEYQLASIGMSGVDWHLAASFVDLYDIVDMFDIQLRIDSLGEHVVGYGEHIHVSGTLAVSKKRALHALRSCEKRQLRARDACSSVIVGMNA